MQSFIYNQLAGRVIFGPAPLDKPPGEIARLGARTGLILFSVTGTSPFAAAKGEFMLLAVPQPWPMSFGR
jgi:hypothetical protein